MHAVEYNYRTVLVEDACRGVNEKEIEVKRLELNKNGCIFVDSNVVSLENDFPTENMTIECVQVPGMVEGVDRRPEVARAMFVENLTLIGRNRPR